MEASGGVSGGCSAARMEQRRGESCVHKRDFATGWGSSWGWVLGYNRGNRLKSATTIDPQPEKFGLQPKLLGIASGLGMSLLGIVNMPL